MWLEQTQRETVVARILEICEELELLHNDAAEYTVDVSESQRRLYSELIELDRKLFLDDD